MRVMVRTEVCDRVCNIIKVVAKGNEGLNELEISLSPLCKSDPAVSCNPDAETRRSNLTNSDITA